MLRLQREKYWIEESQPWSINTGALGIEVGDVQADKDSSHIPVYVSCSVKEFWISLPHSDYELNVLASGFNIILRMSGVAPVRGSQVGIDTQPYTREVFVETLSDTNAESSVGGAVAAKASWSFDSIRSFGLGGTAEGSAGKSKKSKTSSSMKRTEKKVQTRVKYFPQNIWHVRCDFDQSEVSFFDGTVFSDVICRVEGLRKQGKISAEIEFPPEFIKTTKVRNKKTAELIERKTFPDTSKKIGDDGYMTSNAKLAVISAVLQKIKRENESVSLILATHSVTIGETDD